MSRQNGLKEMSTTLKCKKLPKNDNGRKSHSFLEDQLAQLWIKHRLLLKSEGEAQEKRRYQVTLGAEDEKVVLHGENGRKPRKWETMLR